MTYFLECVSCRQQYNSKHIRYRCDCGEVLDIVCDDLNRLNKKVNRKVFDSRLGSNMYPYLSGVWRYKELIYPIEDKFIVSKGEGNTNMYEVGLNSAAGKRRVGEYVSLGNLFLKHEGENPTGSFKDRGMTTGISQALVNGATAVACASTGNTAAALASYAAYAGLTPFIFIPKGKITAAKLAQSLGYGAICMQIEGDFDKVMRLVEKICDEYKIYLLNSINPFRLEGQKTIAYEILQQLSWQSPDWIILPGGNLGNTAAIGKGVSELYQLGLIKKLPRLAVIQASGANPFYQSYKTNFQKRFSIKADTLASAIKIGNPVSFLRAQKYIRALNGVVEQVSDSEMIAAKNVIDGAGIGCELASAATITGLKKLVKKRIIKKSDRVVCVLTGHILKDTHIIMKYHSNPNSQIIKLSIENISEVMESKLRR